MLISVSLYKFSGWKIVGNKHWMLSLLFFLFSISFFFLFPSTTFSFSPPSFPVHVSSFLSIVELQLSRVDSLDQREVILTGADGTRHIDSVWRRRSSSFMSGRRPVRRCRPVVMFFGWIDTEGDRSARFGVDWKHNSFSGLSNCEKDFR